MNGYCYSSIKWNCLFVTRRTLENEMFIRSIALFGALSLLVAASPASLIDENHLIERGKGPKNKSVTLFGPNGTLIVPGQGMYPDKKHNMPGGDWGFNLYPGGPPMHPTKLKFASWDFWYWKENGPETQDFTYYVYNLTELNIEADRWPVEGDGMGQFSRVRGKDPADAFNTANASATFEVSPLVAAAGSRLCADGRFS